MSYSSSVSSLDEILCQRLLLSIYRYYQWISFSVDHDIIVYHWKIGKHNQMVSLVYSRCLLPQATTFSSNSMSKIGVFFEQSMLLLLSFAICLSKTNRHVHGLNCSFDMTKEVFLWRSVCNKFYQVTLSHYYVIFLDFGISKCSPWAFLYMSIESAWENSWSISKWFYQQAEDDDHLDLAFSSRCSSNFFLMK